MGSFENENSKTKHPNLENDALKTRKRSTQNSKARHPNLENEAPKTRKRSTQISKTKHPNLENEAPKTRKRSTQNSKPVCPIKTRDSPLSSHQQHATLALCTMLCLNSCHRELHSAAGRVRLQCYDVIWAYNQPVIGLFLIFFMMFCFYRRRLASGLSGTCLYI